MLAHRVKRWEKRIEVFLSHVLVRNGIWISAFGVLIWFLIHCPPTGAAIAVAGAVGVLAVLRALSKTDKVILVALMVGFVLIELHSIQHDRSAQDDQRSKDDANLQRNFEAVLSEAKNDFHETGKQMEDVASRIEKVSKYVTGGDAFPVIVPQPGNGLITKDGTESIVVPLIIWNHGDYPLTGVTVSVAPGELELGDWVISIYTQPEMFIPEIEPRGHRIIKGIQLTPRLENTDSRSYEIVVNAQNGVYRQHLTFRKSTKTATSGEPLAYCYWITKDNPPNPAHPSASDFVIFARYNYSDEPSSPNNVGK
jgi:hypothetical protein